MILGIGDIVMVPFGWLLRTLYNVTSNYGVSLILFAFIVKLVLLPATAKGKRSTMKMSRLTPRVQEIQEKYANDKQKQAEKMQALYKEEGVSLGGGCLWSLLPLLILIPLYSLVRQPLTYMVEYTGSQVKELLATLGISSRGAYAQMEAAHVSGLVDFDFLGVNLAEVPTWRFWTWEGPLWACLGGALLPVLSACGQLASMLISQRMNNSLVTDKKGIQDKEAAKNSQSNQSMKFMLWVSPIMSLLFGFMMPAALSLYWFAQGLVTTASDVYLTKKYRKIYDAEDAERLKKYLAEQAIEEEKERIRAERRAANPDGITANTSKKKLQQAKQEAKEAEKANNAREYAISKGEAVAEEPKKEKEALSGISSRPNCKGRAYDPNRYKNTEEEK